VGDKKAKGRFKSKRGWCLISVAIVSIAAAVAFLPPADKVVVIFLEGDIFAFEPYITRLSDSLKDDSVKAVVLYIESLGGGVHACFEIEHYVSLLVEKKAVVASFGRYAISGAYLIGSAADKVLTYRNTETAGLGVMAIWIDESEKLGREGIKIFTWTSGREKDLGVPWRPPTENENALMQELVDEYANKLFDTVRANRPQSENMLEGLRDGSTILGEDAVNTYNLADNFGTRDDAIKLAAEMAGIAHYQIIEYK
jgi:protease-4